jgi:hypothetical protein
MAKGLAILGSSRDPRMRLGHQQSAAVERGTRLSKRLEKFEIKGSHLSGFDAIAHVGDEIF